MEKIILIILIGLCAWIPMLANVIYEVSPNGEGLRSLEGAKEDIDNRLSKGDCDEYTIILEDGVYFLEAPLVFTPESWHALDYSITFKSNGGKTVLSGGTNDLIWENDEQKPGIIKTTVDFDVRNLWIEGERMKRANGFTGYALGIFDETIDGVETKGLLFPKEDFPEFKDISGLEISYRKNWRSYYFKVGAIYDNSSLSIVPQDQVLVVCDNFDVALSQTPKMDWIGVGKANPYEFVNALELMDEPGEFCYIPSNHTLYYYLKEDESPTNLDAVIPKLQNIITVNSSNREKIVSNLVFSEVEFSHCGWEWPSKNGFVDHQSSVYYTGVGKRSNIPAAVSVDAAENVKFESCRFTKLGCNGIHVKNNSEHISIEDCDFKDLSGGAISLSDPNHKTYTDSILPIKNILIHNNLIEDIGLEYPSCSAVEVFYAEDVTISHNELYNCPYTGVSVGWGWTLDPTTTKNFKVLNNKIIGNTQKCNDGGAIYSLSYFGEEGLLIEGNYIDEISYKSMDVNQGSLYADQGSSNVRINKNVVLSERKWFFCNQAGKVEIDTTYVLQENRNFYGGKGIEIIYVHDGTHIFCLPDFIADSLKNNAGVYRRNSDLSVITDPIAHHDGFILKLEGNGLQIIPYDNVDTDRITVTLFKIDGTLERRYHSESKELPLWIDSISKGYHIVEILSPQGRWVYRIVL